MPRKPPIRISHIDTHLLGVLEKHPEGVTLKQLTSWINTQITILNATTGTKELEVTERGVEKRATKLAKENRIVRLFGWKQARSTSTLRDGTTQENAFPIRVYVYFSPRHAPRKGTPIPVND